MTEQQVETDAGLLEWQTPARGKQDDPLLDCLLLVARIHGQRVSGDALVAGLPLEEGRLTVELLARAAARAGLSAKVVKRDLSQISDLVLPAVLLLHGRQACVLVGRSDTHHLNIVFPESGHAVQTLAAEELTSAYSGLAVFAGPAHRFEEAAAQTRERPQRWFWDVVVRAWPIYGEVVLASLLINIFALVTPLFTMNVYDRVVPNAAIETLWALTAGVGLVIGFDMLMRILRGYFIDVAGKKIDTILSTNIFERILNIRMDAKPGSVGAFAHNLQEFESFREFITSATIVTLIDLPFVVLFLVAMWWVGGVLVSLPVIAIPLVVAVTAALQVQLSNAVKASSEAVSARQSLLVESLVGLETIKVMSAHSSVQRKWEQTIGEIARLGLKSRLLSAVAVNFAAFVQQIVYIGVVVLGVYQIAGEKLTVGGLIACTILTGRALGPLSQVVGLITRYHQCRSGLRSVDRLMHLPAERELDVPYMEHPRLAGSIEFKDVCFHYPGEKTPVLDHVSFKIVAGERVGIIGRIGSGKTTIEKLILGLYAPTSGTILLDGIDQRQLDPAALRRDIGHVPQDITLFRGSVRDNIALHAPHVDDALVLRAAEIAGVSEFANRSPKGFELQVGERGEALSGGQRQAVAVARAELLSPPVLLLDEPTSAMDNRSEDQLKKRLALQLAQRTLILISHRASLLSLVNRLIVIDRGRIIADGPKNQVISQLSGGKLHVA
jgi:ATP-binding cassette subfamily C protein LapB